MLLTDDLCLFAADSLLGARDDSIVTSCAPRTTSIVLCNFAGLSPVDVLGLTNPDPDAPLELVTVGSTAIAELPVDVVVGFVFTSPGLVFVMVVLAGFTLGAADAAPDAAGCGAAGSSATTGRASGKVPPN